MYREENFQGVDFESLEDSVLNNSSNENALVGILIYYFSKKYRLHEIMNYPMNFTEGIRYAFCEHIFEEQNFLKYQINKMIDTRTKERKDNLLHFHFAFNDSLNFIYGFLIMQKKSEEKIIKNVWTQIRKDKSNIKLLVEKADLPTFFDELIDSYEEISDSSLEFDPYYLTDQYEIDLKNLKKENFEQLKRETMEGIGNTLGGVGNLVKKIIPSSKKEENLGTENKLKKLNQMRTNKTITESEYQKMRVQILNKFTGGESEESFSENNEIVKETTKEIDPSDEEKINLDDFDEELKIGVMQAAEIINNIILNPIKNSKDGKLPTGFWQDEFLLGFISYLTVFTCDTLVDMSEVSTEHKGVSLHLIMGKLCPEESKQVMDDFNKLARNPSRESQKGHQLSMKFCSIMDNTYETAFPNDPDIERAKKMSEMLDSNVSLNIKDMDKLQNQDLFMAFQTVHLTDYVLGMYK